MNRSNRDRHDARCRPLMAGLSLSSLHATPPTHPFEPRYRNRLSAIDAAKFEARRRAREPGRCASCPSLFDRPGWAFLLGLAAGMTIASIAIVAHAALA